MLPVVFSYIAADWARNDSQNQHSNSSRDQHDHLTWNWNLPHSRICHIEMITRQPLQMSVQQVYASYDVSCERF